MKTKWIENITYNQNPWKHKTKCTIGKSRQKWKIADT